MQDVKAILFDNFGVLYPNALSEFLKRHNVTFDKDPTLLQRLTVQIASGQIDETAFYAGLEETVGMPAQAMIAEIRAGLVYDARLVDFIKQLKKIYKIALISNANEEEISIIYKDHLDGLFDAMAISYEVGAVKPDPKIYLVCAERLGVKPAECVLVDDSGANLEGAQKVGMKSVAYPQFGAIPDELLTYAHARPGINVSKEES